MIKILCMLMSILFFSSTTLAHQPVIVEKDSIQIEKPEISRAFYDELKGRPRSYFIDSEKDFDLYINLLVPKNTNSGGRYSAHVYRVKNGQRALLTEIDGGSVVWQEFYEPFGGDTYVKGPEYKHAVPAGRYEIEVYSQDNLGKYVLAVGEKEFFGPKEIAKVYTDVPRLKGEFFGSSPWSFLWTPFGIVLVVVVGGILYLLVRKN